MKVLYTETALAEIDEICSYIARDNEKAAADIAAGNRANSCSDCQASEVGADCL